MDNLVFAGERIYGRIMVLRLILGKNCTIIEDGAAIWLTSIWFGFMHVFAVYVFGFGALIFGILTRTLGLAFGR